MKHPLFMSLSAASPGETLDALAAPLAIHPNSVRRLKIDREEVDKAMDLREEVRNAKIHVFIDRVDPDSVLERDEDFIDLRIDGLQMFRVPNFFTRAEEVLALIEELPGTLFIMNSIWPDEWPDDRTVRRYGFGDGHTDLGWGCAFKGEGHDRLVSRRWLDYGPWRVLRGKNDTTLIQFHDLSLGPEESFAQARIAHDRMGISRQGGFIQQPVVYFNELKGLYDPATRTFKMVVHGRDLTQAEMLDAATYGIEMRTDPKTPIDHVAYVFIDETEAQKHLHELWLRGLQCIAIRNGAELRLDDTYHPTPNPPDWVKALDAA